MEEIELQYHGVNTSDALDSNGSMPLKNCPKLLDIDHLTIQTPTSGEILIRDLSVEIYEKNHLLVGVSYYLVY